MDSNFLSNRHQMVVINGASSSPSAVTPGVPQGYVLGLLFLVYVNDIGSSLRYSSISLFVDDALLYCSIKKYRSYFNRIIHPLNNAQMSGV